MLEQYEKEVLLQESLIERKLKQLNVASSEECQHFTEQVVEKVSGLFAMHRWGHFTAGELSIVYSNMGGNNMHVLEQYSRQLRLLGNRELASAIWPKDAPYSWAVLIADPDGEHLQQVAVECWKTG